MAVEFQLHVLCPDRNFYEGPCTSLILPTPDGEYGVLAGHVNTAAALVPGVLNARLPDGSVLSAVVGYGMARIEGDDVLVLVGSAERPEEIDTARAKRAAEKARAELLQKHGWQEHLQTQANLNRALTRLKAAKRQP